MFGNSNNFAYICITNADMKHLTLVRIAPSQNSWSSIDVNLHCMGDKRNLIRKFYKEFFKSFSETVEIKGEMWTIHHITIGSSASCIRIKDQWDKDKINTIAKSIMSFDGFKYDYPEIYDDYWNIRDIKNTVNTEKERIDAEYVLWKLYPKVHSPKEYVGGFNLETFFVESLISYVERGITFGYIGHSCRKIWVDKLLAEICLKHIKEEDFANWLTSTDGRHFGDSIEHLVEDDDRKAVEEVIKNRLPEIYNTSLIYSHPEHTGTFSSYDKLYTKLKDLGVLMVENNNENEVEE
jgi:hypothetical protein